MYNFVSCFFNLDFTYMLRRSLLSGVKLGKQMSAEAFGEILLWRLVKGLFYFLESRFP